MRLTFNCLYSNLFKIIIAGMLSLAFVVVTSCVNYIGIGSNKKITPPSAFQTSKSLPKQHGLWPTTAWAKDFGDPQLPLLIKEALSCNPRLQVTQARIGRAQALADVQRAALYPNLNGHADFDRVRLSSRNFLPSPIFNSIFTQSFLLADLNYSLDIWGKNRASFRQALSQEKAQAAADQEARLSLAISVASTYNQLAYYYALRGVLKRTVAQRESIGKLSKIRLRSGLDTRTQIFQSRNSTETARTQLVATEGQIILTRQQLGILLGKGPDRGLTIKRPQLKAIRTPPLPANLPFNLLGRRPDIVQARWNVEANCQGIRVAKARFYPNVNLTAGALYLGLSLSHFLAAANSEYVGPAITLPLFDAGSLRAQLREQYANYEEAVANYNDTLNNAFGDVARQLTSIHSTDQQLATQKTALYAAERAYNLAVIQYRTGLASQLVVLDAESRYLTEQQTRLQLITDRRDQQLALIKALGGGFGAPCKIAKQATDCCRSPSIIV